MSKPRIAVIMSTYNGEDHLACQVDSILAQGGVDVTLTVRDDGSSDGTVALLEAYERRGDLTLIRGENLGVVGSFLDLIARVPAEYDLIALSDQDDRWHPDKLSRAASVLAGKDASLPQLYCSEYVFCDGGLNPKGRSHLNRHGVDFQRMLYENMVSGNTTVINRALADCVMAAGRDCVYCHDWWLALLACSLGELTYDDFASLDYRRTGDNVSPTGSGGLSLLRYRIHTFFDKGELANITAQLQRLREVCGDDLPASKRALLDRMLDGGRFAKAFTPCRLRQKMGEELALRLLFLLGLL